MNMLKQTKPVDVGPGNVIGELIDTNTNPIDALKTILVQVEKAREWNCESLKEALHNATESTQGLELSLELAEMQLEAIVNSPLFSAAPLLLKAAEQFVSEFERGREWVSEDTLDMFSKAISQARNS